jgi:hypothetical protein
MALLEVLLDDLFAWTLGRGVKLVAWLRRLGGHS